MRIIMKINLQKTQRMMDNIKLIKKENLDLNKSKSANLVKPLMNFLLLFKIIILRLMIENFQKNLK